MSDIWRTAFQKAEENWECVEVSKSVGVLLPLNKKMI